MASLWWRCSRLVSTRRASVQAGEGGGLGIIYTVLLAMVLPTTATAGSLTLSPLFSDRAVLQADRPVPIWGQADPGEAIVVLHRHQKLQTQADADGRWQVVLKPMPADRVGQPLTVKGQHETVQALDLVVGEVWLCAGQSNMAIALAATKGGPQVAANASDRALRFFRVPDRTAASPMHTLDGGTWITGAADKLGGMSAVAYYFGEHLRQKLGKPVGLLVCAVGTTPIEAWIDEPLLRQLPEMEPTFADWAALPVPEPGAEAVFQARYDQWQRDLKTWHTTPHEQRGPRPPAPQRERNNPFHPRRPALLYNGMLAPLSGMTLRGGIWYQGEGNAWRARQYRVLLPTLIQCWRRDWQQDDLPVGVVQLPGWKTGSRHANSVAWLRDAQQQVADRLDHVGLIVTTDTSENDGDIHPVNKRPVGERLARWALCDVYGQVIDADGPRFHQAQTLGRTIVVTFKAKGQLRARGERLGGWQVAGADGVFVPAQARIRRPNQVVVSADAVAAPRYVRYLWEDWPRAAVLFDDTGLPAAQFRTDQQPDPTIIGGW